MIKAYCNNKDVITIKSDDNLDTFTINDEEIYATLIRKEDSINVFKAKYPLEFNKTYIIKNSKNEETFLEMNLVTKTSYFDDYFYYDKDDLGATFSKNETTFKIWAPISSKVRVEYSYNNKTYIEDMEYEGKGIYKLTIKRNLSSSLYSYLITNNGKEIEVNDIYAFSSNANFKKGAIIDPNKLVKLENYPLKKIKRINDCIIYETSIRDFSMKLDIKNKGTFKAFIEDNLVSNNNNPIGFNYLKQLGISHVQLMPINEIATIDDNNPSSTYNWGYDTLAYNVLEGSYSTNPNNPYTRINEFREMVNALHKNGIRVNVDFVFNHTYSKENNMFDLLVPNYFYLMDENGNLSNGSFCGNDLDTTKKMVSKYIIDMAKRYVSFYGIDGIRLDLMGILSIDLVNKIYQECRKINPDFVLYGEGWNMPSMLESEKRATLVNAFELDNIAFFNDTFRDTMKGKNLDKGYINGNTYCAYHAIRAMRGCVETGCYFMNSKQSINYIDCHDNYTLYDKLLLSNKNDNEVDRNKMVMLALASILFAEGIPFIHSGMEFNRTKHGVENSYNSSDEINAIDWSLVDKYQANIKAFKDSISIRNKEECFKLQDKKTILNSIDGYTIDNRVNQLTYAYDGKVIILLFNPSNKKITVNFNTDYYHIATEKGIINPISISRLDLKPLSFNMLVK